MEGLVRYILKVNRRLAVAAAVMTVYTVCMVVKRCEQELKIQKLCDELETLKRSEGE